MHLGAKLAFLGVKAPEHRERLLQAFRQSVSLALTEQVDLFLVGGDLFDSNYPAATTLNLVIQEFSKLVGGRHIYCFNTRQP